MGKTTCIRPNLLVRNHYNRTKARNSDEQDNGRFHKKRNRNNRGFALTVGPLYNLNKLYKRGGEIFWRSKG